jgi:hypothetical protein
MKFLFFILAECFLITVRGQVDYQDPVYFTNHIFSDNIRTVQLYNEKWNLSYPFLKLGSSDRMAFHFDLLDDHAETFYYTFIHCDKDWNKSDIFPEDYTDGYAENPIEDYKPSFNTTVRYFHYKLTFPNNRVQLKLSGNYILVVYPYDQPESPVITQRFIVFEDQAGININVHRPLVSDNKNAEQQVDFTVTFPDRVFTDPYRNFFAFILQNGRWDNAKKNLKPDFSGISELKYTSLSDINIFQGGNEFRYFDIKSIRYQSEYIKGIEFVNQEYNVYLYPSENREYKPYFYWKDFNGKYYIAIQEEQEPDTDADYVNVFFTLPSKQMIAGGDMYVSGELSNWNFDNNNRMIYNTDRSQYECTMLLKQGWYNYEYAYLKKGSTDGTASLFEGSHYETENDYNVIIYYRSSMARYDRVIGLSTFNTLNRISN